MTVSNLSPGSTQELPLADGRRERSRSSRSKIVAAMLDLVSKGDVSPSAARVAEVADVGLRTVFRHFEDMDALYREMGDIIEARILPILLTPPAGESWKDKMFDLAERRAKIFEMIMPYRISGNIRRFESPYLMNDYRRMLRLEGESIDAHLPDAVRADLVGARGLNVILSFHAWQLLRYDQELPIDEAKAVIRKLLSSALAQLPDS